MIDIMMIIYAIIAFIVTAWAMKNARGWREYALAIIVGGLWLFALLLVLAVMVSDWRAAKRMRGRIL